MAKKKKSHYTETELQHESQRATLFGICVAFNFWDKHHVNKKCKPGI